jgi:UDP-N-acetylglucosamine transferase subunit ALG13
MILVTVGAQMPFDRLVKGVDSWASSRHRQDVFAQIGTTTCYPSYIRWTHWLSPSEFRKQIKTSAAMVAHAGMGSIIAAQELGKPILVMPRRSDIGETRNDHQFATARRFFELGRVLVAFDESELASKLDQLAEMSYGRNAERDRCSQYSGDCPHKKAHMCAAYSVHGACPNLLMALRHLIECA